VNLHGTLLLPGIGVLQFLQQICPKKAGKRTNRLEPAHPAGTLSMQLFLAGHVARFRGSQPDGYRQRRLRLCRADTRTHEVSVARSVKAKITPTTAVRATMQRMIAAPNRCASSCATICVISCAPNTARGLERFRPQRVRSCTISAGIERGNMSPILSRSKLWRAPCPILNRFVDECLACRGHRVFASTRSRQQPDDIA
jgi:hypothetical protein